MGLADLALASSEEVSMDKLQDADPAETQEWVDSIEGVIAVEGPERAHFLLGRVLGTNGYGRSDYRRKLRRFFEVDRSWVTLAALESLALDGAIKATRVAEAIKKYGIDPEKPNPARV